MAISKANQRAVNKYVKANYDRINVTMPKGRKDKIKALADTQGRSVNAYIISAIDEKMGRENGEAAAGSPQESGVVSLPPDTLETAQRAAERTGETVTAFVVRAVATQEKRDENGFKLGINPA